MAVCVGAVPRACARAALTAARRRRHFQAVEKATNPVHIFENSPELRSMPAELNSATRWLRDHVAMLSDMPQGKLERIASALVCKSFAAGEVVRPEGGDTNFYIVLKGRVLVGAVVPPKDAHRLRFRSKPSIESSAVAMSEWACRTVKEPYTLATGECIGAMGTITVRSSRCCCYRGCAGVLLFTVVVASGCVRLCVCVWRVCVACVCACVACVACVCGIVRAVALPARSCVGPRAREAARAGARGRRGHLQGV